MTTLKLTFPNEEGIDLSARLDLPEGDVKAYAIFAHNFAGSKESLAASRISRALTREGIAVLRLTLLALAQAAAIFHKPPSALT